MAEEHTENQKVTPATTVTDDAVGVPQSHWFVAIVHHNTEKKLHELLSRQGYNVYIATQPRLRISPSGRKKWVESLVVHSRVFIKCTEQQRLRIVTHPLIHRFMTNPSGEPVNGHKPVATVPEKEMEMLRYMLGQSEIPVEFSAERLKKGEKVRVIRGPLKGFEGEVIETGVKNKEILISLDLLGSAKVSIPDSDLQTLRFAN